MDMRYIVQLLLLSFGICQPISSQGIQTNIVQNNLGIDYKMRDFVVNTKLLNNDYGEKYLGSFYLFDNWNKNSHVQIRGKKFAFYNVNFNVKNNEFMSEVSKDSVFTLLPEYIDFITIDTKVYKYKLYKGVNKFFEVLFESEKNPSIYRGYNIRIILKSELGMLNRPYDEIKKDEKFYILYNDELVVLKLKKKDLLKFIDNDKQEAILKFVKEKGLSYKNEKDVIVIFKYYDSI